MIAIIAWRAEAIMPYATKNAMKSDTATFISVAFHQITAMLPIWQKAIKAGMIFTANGGL